MNQRRSAPSTIAATMPKITTAMMPAQTPALKIPSMAAHPLVVTRTATSAESALDESRMTWTNASREPQATSKGCT